MTFNSLVAGPLCVRTSVAAKSGVVPTLSTNSGVAWTNAPGTTPTAGRAKPVVIRSDVSPEATVSIACCSPSIPTSKYCDGSSFPAAWSADNAPNTNVSAPITTFTSGLDWRTVFITSNPNSCV